MKKDSSNASRGMVFFYSPLWAIYGKGKVPKNILFSGSLENKERPYLVISNNAGNFSSTTCNVIPITTRSETAIPTQVKFLHNDRPQVILTEQITTANILDLGDYCYSVSEDVLTQVEKGLALQLGIKNPDMTIDELSARLNVMTDRIIANLRKRAKVIPAPAVNDVVNRIADKFSENLGKLEPVFEQALAEAKQKEEAIIDQPEPEPEKPKPVQPVQNKPQLGRTMSPIEKFNTRYNCSPATENSAEQILEPSGVSPAEPAEKPDGKRRYSTWDISKKKAFLEDYYHLTTDELREKYGFSSKSSVYSRLNILRKERAEGKI